jgi:hypothetical protein
MCADVCQCGNRVNMMDGSGSACSLCKGKHFCSAKCGNAHYYAIHGRPPKRMTSVPHCDACFYALHGEGTGCPGCDEKFCRPECLAFHQKRGHRAQSSGIPNGFDNELRGDAERAKR